MPNQNPRFAPVPVMVGRIGTTRLVSSAREAAECMLDASWPDKHSSADRCAREVLLEALAGRASGEETRAAFEAAAKVAGVWVENIRGSR